MNWPKITENYTDPNGFTIEPIGSRSEAIRHGQEMRNGLEIAGIYHEIAASGGNVIFGVRDQNGTMIGSGSLKSGNEGVAFVNFLRGYNNVEIPKNHPAYRASENWAEKINDRSIDLKAIPSAAGLFIKAPENIPAPTPEPTPAPEPEPRPSVVSRAMSAFRNIVLHSRLHSPTPIQNVAPEATPENGTNPEPEIDFIPRDIPEGAWTGLASPGTPDPETGLSVVPVTDAKMLRYLLEQCECRMMWERNQAQDAIQRGVIQVAAIMNDNANSPVIGYALFGTRDGQPVLTQVTGRFDHMPTPEIRDTAIRWIEAVRNLQPGEAGPNGIIRNIGINGARFMVENYEPGTEPHYDDFGRLVEDRAEYNPDLAYSDIRSLRNGAINPPDITEVTVHATSMPTLTRLENNIPGLQFSNIDILSYDEVANTPIDVSEVLAGRAVPFEMSSASFGIVEGVPVREEQNRADERHIAEHQADDDGLSEADRNGNGVPDADESAPRHPEEDQNDDPFARPPRILALLHVGDTIELSMVPDRNAVNTAIINAVATAIKSIASLSPTLKQEMKEAVSPVVETAAEFYPDMLPEPPRPAPTPEEPTPRTPPEPTGNGPSPF